MRYKSGGAFRRALETRLRDQSLESGLPLVRLRKMVAFDRLLARLALSQPDQWILKGGLMLQLRLGNRARTTKDIDLLFLSESHKVLGLLREAVTLDLGERQQIWRSEVFHRFDRWIAGTNIDVKPLESASIQQ